jgi:hypothetical protein
VEAGEAQLWRTRIAVACVFAVRGKNREDASEHRTFWIQGSVTDFAARSFDLGGVPPALL